MAVQCLILSLGLKDYGHLLVLLSNRKAPFGVEHAFCLTPTDEASHSATIVVLCLCLYQTACHLPTPAVAGVSVKFGRATHHLRLRPEVPPGTRTPPSWQAPLPRPTAPLSQCRRCRGWSAPGAGGPEGRGKSGPRGCGRPCAAAGHSAVAERWPCGSLRGGGAMTRRRRRTRNGGGGG